MNSGLISGFLCTGAYYTEKATTGIIQTGVCDVVTIFVSQWLVTLLKQKSQWLLKKIFIIGLLMLIFTFELLDEEK